METKNELALPEKLATALNINAKIRPCCFDPATMIEYIPGNPDTNTPPLAYLSSGAKRLWFYDYCQQAGAVGSILPDCNVNFNVMERDGKRYGYVIAKADVIINNVLIGSAKVGQAFDMSSLYELDNVVQMATGSAVSKALTNAGFGALPIADIEMSNPLHNYEPNTDSFQASANAGPFTNIVQAMGNVPNVPFGPFGSDPHTGNQVNGRTPTPHQSEHSQPAVTGVAAPEELAKQTRWPLAGVNKNKTLGEVLATRPSDIEWLAQSWHGTGPAKEAAKLLLPEALEKMGKAVRV